MRWAILTFRIAVVVDVIAIITFIASFSRIRGMGAVLIGALASFVAGGILGILALIFIPLEGPLFAHVIYWLSFPLGILAIARWKTAK
jgi:hypothetical protein